MLSEEIFNTLKGYGYLVELYGEDGKGPLASSDLASYIYAKDKTTEDSIMIRLPEKDDSSEYAKVVIYKSQAMDDKFTKLIMTIKNLAIKSGDTVTIRQFGRNIEPKDLAFLPQGEKEMEVNSVNENKRFDQAGEDFYDADTGEFIATYPRLVNRSLGSADKEGRKRARTQFQKDHPEYKTCINEAAKYNRFGTSRSSYHVLPENKKAKVIIRHSKRVIDETSVGARSRNVKNLYVESSNGERRLIETKSLMCARAVANYVNNGGQLFDESASKIIKLSEDIKGIRKLKKKYPVSEDSSNKKIHDSLTSVYEGLIDFMKGLNGSKIETMVEALNLNEPNVKFAESFYKERLGEDYDVSSLARGSVLYTRTRKFLPK